MGRLDMQHVVGVPADAFPCSDDDPLLPLEEQLEVAESLGTQLHR